MFLYAGTQPDIFYKAPHTARFPNSYILPCVEIEDDVRLDAPNVRLYRAHNRLVSNVTAYEVRVKQQVVAYLFTPGVGDVVMVPESLTVIRRAAYAELVASASDPARKPDDRRTAFRRILQNQNYYVFAATNVATLIVPAKYDEGLDKALSNSS